MRNQPPWTGGELSINKISGDPKICLELYIEFSRSVVFNGG